MTIYIDPPTWPGHGRVWSHLISDVSYDELHAFAEGLGIPRRAFERDHYDVAAERFDAAVRAGARVVSSREIVDRLHAAGLRRRKVSRRAGPSEGSQSVVRRSQPTRGHPDVDRPRDP